MSSETHVFGRTSPILLIYLSGLILAVRFSLFIREFTGIIFKSGRIAHERAR